MDSIDELLQIMAALRDPLKGCPWDREQDFSSIAPHTIEEAYEVADAINKNDMASLCSELGDLLFQVVYHSQLAAEQGSFQFSNVVESIKTKILKQHPHVFGDEVIENAKAQSLAWEKFKLEERKAATNSGLVSILEGISINLPALSRAQKLQKRAAHAGFDWNDIREVIVKIEEELQELKTEIEESANLERLQDEVGDLLFSCVNFARHLEVDAESALRGTNRKFEQRFRYIEENLYKQNRTIEEAGLEEMDKLWEESKNRPVE